MKKSVSHTFDDESLEAKSRWFSALSLQERMELFCEFTDLIIAANPHILEQKKAQPVAGRIRVLGKA